ncbi:MAG: phosphate ABC transporter permease PstA [Solirubrobacterales bacterium]
MSRVVGSAPTRDRVKGLAFQALLVLSLSIGFVTLIALLVDVASDGLNKLSWDFVSSFPSSLPGRAGIQSPLVGTILLMFLVALFTVPIGVGAALYLEEYADRERWYNRAIEINIQNLAAVPSIVYGILGLAFLVRGLDLGRVLLAGALTLTLLVLPIVIIAAREAIRAVPDSIREGALALGATRWQMIRRQILPAAVPGIATGSILALSRAIGETAPLILIGAIVFVPFNPTSLDSAFTALPIQIFNWTTRPQEEFKLLAAAAIIVLLGLLLTMNAFAIWLRNKYQRRW